MAQIRYLGRGFPMTLAAKLQALLASPLSTAQIARRAGVGATTISALRRDPHKVTTLTAVVTDKLTAFYDDLNREDQIAELALQQQTLQADAFPGLDWQAVAADLWEDCHALEVPAYIKAGTLPNQGAENLQVSLCGKSRLRYQAQMAGLILATPVKSCTALKGGTLCVFEFDGTNQLAFKRLY